MQYEKVRKVFQQHPRTAFTAAQVAIYAGVNDRVVRSVMLSMLDEEVIVDLGRGHEDNSRMYVLKEKN